MNLIKNIAIGTVQFGLDYGISNTQGEVSIDEINCILDYAIANGISTLDTAKAYNRSEQKLGEIALEKFDIITKLITLNNFEKDIEDSFTKLNVQSLYAVLVHDFHSFINNEKEYHNFRKACIGKTKIGRIGFSLNRLSELEYLLENNIEFDIIQVPYNIFDQRFSAYFQQLKSLDVEIHTRSTFLQGLFFLENKKIPIKLLGLNPSLTKIKKISKDSSISIESLALNFVLYNKFIDKVVIGVTSKNELNKNIIAIENSIFDDDLYKELVELRVENENLILPMNWNK